MKKLIILFSIILSSTIYAQSYFNGGQSSQTVDPTIRVVEVVYKYTSIDDIDVILAVEKIIEGHRFSYNVRFFGEGNIFNYDKGYIRIDDFDILEGSYYYSVSLHYTHTKLYYKTKVDKNGDLYEQPFYNSNGTGVKMFDVNKYGIK